MTRPAFLRVLACLGTGLLLMLAVPLPATGVARPAAAQPADPAPLTVSIDSLTPSTIPRSGRITVTGQVTNHSDETWTSLNAYLLTSAAPMRTAEELEAGAATDAAAVIGERITDPGLYDELGQLPPGSSADYVLSVPRRALGISGESGVYWLGVHVLGTSDAGSDVVADGRARTFIPLLRPQDPGTTMTLLMPVKARVRREGNATLTDLVGWQELLSPEGRLGRLLALSGTSTGLPLTWVLDPAVLDAAQTVALDNAPLSIDPTDGEPDPADADSPGSPTGPDDPDETGDPGELPGEGEEVPEPTAEARVAQSWLDTFRRQAEQHTVLAVPYGDVDVASMARRDLVALYDDATDLSGRTMESFGVASRPVVAPPPGVLPRPAFTELDTDTLLVLADRAAPEAESSLIETGLGHEVLLTDSSAAQGGPGPTPAFRALAMRQRILSEAALHALSERRWEPLAVATPSYWDPGSDWRAAEFFGGLQVPWLRVVDAPTAVALARARGEVEEYDGPLVYPARQRRAELPLANLLASEELVEAGRAFAALLTRNDTVDTVLAKSAMLTSSYPARRYQQRAVAAARSATERTRSLMSRVSVDGPPFVTMSSDQGAFQVTLENDLTEPVTVGVEAETESDDLRITEPEPISLAPGQRASVRLRASSEDIGVHSVTVVPVNTDGEPIGEPVEFTVRSSQVGLVIWVIMGFGALVLVAASTVRIVRRVRSRRAVEQEPAEPVGSATR